MVFKSQDVLMLGTENADKNCTRKPIIFLHLRGKAKGYQFISKIIIKVISL